MLSEAHALVFSFSQLLRLLPFFVKLTAKQFKARAALSLGEFKRDNGQSVIKAASLLLWLASFIVVTNSAVLPGASSFVLRGSEEATGKMHSEVVSVCGG